MVGKTWHDLITLSIPVYSASCTLLYFIFIDAAEHGEICSVYFERAVRSRCVHIVD